MPFFLLYVINTVLTLDIERKLQELLDKGIIEREMRVTNY